VNLPLIICIFFILAVIVGAIVCIVVFLLSPMGRGQRIATELRGAHLVWWMAWAVSAVGALSGWALDLPRCLYGSLVAVAAGGWVAKLLVLSVARQPRLWAWPDERDGRYETWRRYYLFWATGTLPVAIALAPGLGYALWCLASGWLARKGL
jgi:hypothetical protein